jgi:predicted DNA-binding protein
MTEDNEMRTGPEYSMPLGAFGGDSDKQEAYRLRKAIEHLASQMSDLSSALDASQERWEYGFLIGQVGKPATAAGTVGALPGVPGNSATVDALNAAGAEGWELIGVAGVDSNRTIWALKRRRT